MNLRLSNTKIVELPIEYRLIGYSRELTNSMRLIITIPKSYEISEVGRSLGIDDPMGYAKKMQDSLDGIVTSCDNLLDTLNSLHEEMKKIRQYSDPDYENIHSIIEHIKKTSIETGVKLQGLLNSNGYSCYFRDLRRVGMRNSECRRVVINDLMIPMIHACSKVRDYRCNHHYTDSIRRFLTAYVTTTDKSLQILNDLKSYETSFC